MEIELLISKKASYDGLTTWVVDDGVREFEVQTPDAATGKQVLEMVMFVKSQLEGY